MKICSAEHPSINPAQINCCGAETVNLNIPFGEKNWTINSSQLSFMSSKDEKKVKKKHESGKKRKKTATLDFLEPFYVMKKVGIQLDNTPTLIHTIHRNNPERSCIITDESTIINSNHGQNILPQKTPQGYPMFMSAVQSSLPVVDSSSASPSFVVPQNLNPPFNKKPSLSFMYSTPSWPFNNEAVTVNPTVIPPECIREHFRQRFKKEKEYEISSSESDENFKRADRHKRLKENIINRPKREKVYGKKEKSVYVQAYPAEDEKRNRRPSDFDEETYQRSVMTDRRSSRKNRSRSRKRSLYRDRDMDKYRKDRGEDRYRDDWDRYKYRGSREGDKYRDDRDDYKRRKKGKDRDRESSSASEEDAPPTRQSRSLSVSKKYKDKEQEDAINYEELNEVLKKLPALKEYLEGRQINIQCLSPSSPSVPEENNNSCQQQCINQLLKNIPSVCKSLCQNQNSGQYGKEQKKSKNCACSEKNAEQEVNNKYKCMCSGEIKKKCSCKDSSSSSSILLCGCESSQSPECCCNQNSSEECDDSDDEDEDEYNECDCQPQIVPCPAYSKKVNNKQYDVKCCRCGKNEHESFVYRAEPYSSNQTDVFYTQTYNSMPYIYFTPYNNIFKEPFRDRNILYTSLPFRNNLISSLRNKSLTLSYDQLSRRTVQTNHENEKKIGNNRPVNIKRKGKLMSINKTLIETGLDINQDHCLGKTTSEISDKITFKGQKYKYERHVKNSGMLYKKMRSRSLLRLQSVLNEKDKEERSRSSSDIMGMMKSSTSCSDCDCAGFKKKKHGKCNTFCHCNIRSKNYHIKMNSIQNRAILSKCSHFNNIKSYSCSQIDQFQGKYSLTSNSNGDYFCQFKDYANIVQINKHEVKNRTIQNDSLNKCTDSSGEHESYSHTKKENHKTRTSTECQNRVPNSSDLETMDQCLIPNFWPSSRVQAESEPSTELKFETTQIKPLDSFSVKTKKERTLNYPAVNQNKYSIKRNTLFRNKQLKPAIILQRRIFNEIKNVQAEEGELENDSHREVKLKKQKRQFNWKNKKRDYSNEYENEKSTDRKKLRKNLKLLNSAQDRFWKPANLEFFEHCYKRQNQNKEYSSDSLVHSERTDGKNDSVVGNNYPVFIENYPFCFDYPYFPVVLKNEEGDYSRKYNTHPEYSKKDNCISKKRNKKHYDDISNKKYKKKNKPKKYNKTSYKDYKIYKEDSFENSFNSLCSCFSKESDYSICCTWNQHKRDKNVQKVRKDIESRKVPKEHNRKFEFFPCPADKYSSFSSSVESLLDNEIYETVSYSDNEGIYVNSDGNFRDCKNIKHNQSNEVDYVKNDSSNKKIQFKNMDKNNYNHHRKTKEKHSTKKEKKRKKKEKKNNGDNLLEQIIPEKEIKECLCDQLDKQFFDKIISEKLDPSDEQKNKTCHSFRDNLGTNEQCEEKKDCSVPKTYRVDKGTQCENVPPQIIIKQNIICEKCHKQESEVSKPVVNKKSKKKNGYSEQKNVIDEKCLKKEPSEMSVSKIVQVVVKKKSLNEMKPERANVILPGCSVEENCAVSGKGKHFSEESKHKMKSVNKKRPVTKCMVVIETKRGKNQLERSNKRIKDLSLLKCEPDKISLGSKFSSKKLTCEKKINDLNITCVFKRKKRNKLRGYPVFYNKRKYKMGYVIDKKRINPFYKCDYKVCTTSVSHLSAFEKRPSIKQLYKSQEFIQLISKNESDSFKRVEKNESKKVASQIRTKYSNLKYNLKLKSKRKSKNYKPLDKKHVIVLMSTETAKHAIPLLQNVHMDKFILVKNYLEQVKASGTSFISKHDKSNNESVNRIYIKKTFGSYKSKLSKNKMHRRIRKNQNMKSVQTIDKNELKNETDKSIYGKKNKTISVNKIRTKVCDEGYRFTKRKKKAKDKNINTKLEHLNKK